MIEVATEANGLPPGGHVCPRCGRPVDRVHRSASDRMVSMFYPVWRFRCRADGCEWQGLLRQTPTASRSRTGSARSRTAWIAAGALLVALIGLAVAIYWFYDRDAMPVPTAPAKLVASTPPKLDAPRLPAQDSGYSCFWFPDYNTCMLVLPCS